MRAIRFDKDPNTYQFSVEKFRTISDNWDKNEHDGVSFQKFLKDKLYLNKDCFYNYYHGCNGMDKQYIDELTKLLGISIYDLLEIRPNEKKRGKNMNKLDCTLALSDFSKNKLFQVMICVDEVVRAFFAIFEAEEEFYKLTENLRLNSIAIPDEILDTINSFIYDILEPMIDDPDTYFESLSEFKGKDLESCRKRNRKHAELQEKFENEYLNPFLKKIKLYLI